MTTEVKNKSKFREILKFISTVVSWTIFVLLIICIAFLVYYFVAIKIYTSKGSGYEPAFSVYMVVTPSMRPNINPYDVVIDVKVKNPEDIEINDVITFYSSIPGVKGGTITHRVIGISKDTEGNYKFRTKGDYNLVDDGVDVEFDKIVGKVAIRIPELGRVQTFVASKTGWLVCVLIPALYVIVKDILKILKVKDINLTKKKKLKLIPHKKVKLLPYKEVPEEKNEDIPLEVSNNNLEIEKNIEETQNEEKEKIMQIINYYEEDEDDFELPSLK